MLVDVFMFIKLHGIKCECLFAIEFFTVFIYVSVFVYMNIQGFLKIDEDVEFLLMCVRLTLQFLRLFLAIMKVNKVGKQRNDNDNTNIDIECAAKSVHTDYDNPATEMIVI